MEVTVEYLEEQIKALEHDEATLLAQANISRGAILQCQKLIRLLQTPKDSMTMKELEKAIERGATDNPTKV